MSQFQGLVGMLMGSSKSQIFSIWIVLVSFCVKFMFCWSCSSNQHFLCKGCMVQFGYYHSIWLYTYVFNMKKESTFYSFNYEGFDECMYGTLGFTTSNKVKNHCRSRIYSSPPKKIQSECLYCVESYNPTGWCGTSLLLLLSHNAFKVDWDGGGV